MKFKLITLITLFLISRSFATADFLFRSGDVGSGVSYDASAHFFRTERSQYYGIWQIREWRVGINKRFEIFATPWHLFSVGVKVNILQTGTLKMFKNVSIAPYAGLEGLTLSEMLELLFRIKSICRMYF